MNNQSMMMPAFANAVHANANTMQLFFIFIATIFISISSNAQTKPIDTTDIYHYDTTLKGGYTISVSVDDSSQYLYLKKADKIIIELSSTSRGLLYKNLGYVGADFTNFFVLVHSFGSGNPHYIELIKKSTGKNVLQDGATWIDVDEEKEFLLYSENDSPNKKNKMTLLNIRTGQKQLFHLPNDLFDEPEVLNRIQISKLTNKQLVVKYDTQNGPKTKVYIR